LVELILAVTLSSIVILGMSSLLLPLVRSEVAAARGQTVQLNLAAALKTADREISQASWLRTPPAPGKPADRLEGCQNASAPTDVALAEPLDPAQPMRWFALCPADGLLYYHTGPGCPSAYPYLCGSAPAAVFGGGTSPQAQASFLRSSPFTTVVDIDLSMTSGGTSGSLSGAAAFAGAAGTNQ
jgi:Tfp pilus assembly protein PilV